MTPELVECWFGTCNVYKTSKWKDAGESNMKPRLRCNELLRAPVPFPGGAGRRTFFCDGRVHLSLCGRSAVGVWVFICDPPVYPRHCFRPWTQHAKTDNRYLMPSKSQWEEGTPKWVVTEQPEKASANIQATIGITRVVGFSIEIINPHQILQHT